jgi:hypothetical protein
MRSLRIPSPALPFHLIPLLALPGLFGGCAWISGSELDEALQPGAIALELTTLPDAWDACVQSYTYEGTVDGRYALEVFDATLTLDEQALASERVTAGAVVHGRAEIAVTFEPVDGLPLAGGAATITVMLTPTNDSGEPTSDEAGSEAFEIDITPAPTRYLDSDGDTFGDEAKLTCDAAEGVATGGDCNDADADTYPGAPELCDGADNDCDGSPAAVEGDADGDGFSICDPAAPDDLTAVSDCDDDPLTGADINPGATEVVGNAIDENCDDDILCYVDFDGDGFPGADPGTLIALADYLTCEAARQGGEEVALPPTVEVPLDCDDSADGASIYPGAPELCDGVDTDCDGDTPLDETDVDGDTFLACSVDEPDCDDTNPNVNPGEIETCDGVVDTDCDPSTVLADEVDGDGDGWFACVGPTGTTAMVGDCDDTNANVNPGQIEICNDGPVSIDDDCDLATVPAGGEENADDDGFLSCNDCDDTDPFVNPGLPEEPADDIDNDCDGVWSCFVDNDNDGFAADDAVMTTTSPMACSATANVSGVRTDCDDTNAAVFLGAPEQCDGLDNDCDGDVPADEQDADADLFLECGSFVGAAPFLGGDDCRDDLGQVNPGADELCTPLDEDCDGDGYAGALHIGVIQDADPDATTGFDVFPAGFSLQSAARIEVCGPVAAMTADRVLLDEPVEIVGIGANAALGVSLTLSSGDASITDVALTPVGIPDTEPGGVIQHTSGGQLTLVDVVIDCAIAPAALTCPPTSPSGDVPTSGGAIASTDLVMNGVTIQSCWASSTGGAIAVDGPATLDDVLLTGNVANARGGAIAIDASGSLTWAGAVEVQGNFAGDSGGGIVLDDGASIDVALGTASTVTDNEACQNGGGIALLDANTATLGSVSVLGNVARQGAGGGLYASNAGDITLEDLVFADNRADALPAMPSDTDGAGGGAWIDAGSNVEVTVVGTDFFDNVASGGGGLWVETAGLNGRLTMDDTDFGGNHDTALTVRGLGQATIEDTLFDRNWTTWTTDSGAAIDSSITQMLLDTTTGPVVFDANAVVGTGPIPSAGLLNVELQGVGAFCTCSSQFGIPDASPLADPPDGGTVENHGTPKIDGAESPLFVGAQTNIYCQAGEACAQPTTPGARCPGFIPSASCN